MTTDNKRVTNKQILDKINALKVGDEGLNALAVKIVSKMMNIQTMSEWYEHVSSSDIAIEVMDKKLNLTEEENAVGDMAKYMTLMNMFEDKEEYEKCAVCKLKILKRGNI
jgi:hypothetical protein